MIYVYKALNKQGNTISDFIDASNESVAKQKLRSQGLYVVKIKQQESVVPQEISTKQSSLFKTYDEIVNYFKLKLSSKQVGIFSRQLATLLRAGMPLLVAITDIIDQIDNQNFKKIIVDIKEKIEEGSSLSNCLQRHKIVFSDMYINMVRVGENLGSLDTVIERLAVLEEKKNILKSKIQAALWYPAFMITFATAVIIFLMTYIIPSIEKMIVDMGKEVPLPTAIVLGLSKIISHFWWVFLIAVIIAIYYLNRYAKTEQGKVKIDELKLRVPLFSNLYKKLIVLKFTQNLGVLLNNKVDILKSFEIVKKIVGNIIIEGKIEEAARKVREGSSVSNALARSDFLPKLVLGMISAGEASDNLDTMLLNIGNVYETELDLTVTSLTSMIEPIIIIIMGVIIGTVVISVLLPIFEMNLIMQ
jgi:general secretion pathway protein F